MMAAQSDSIDKYPEGEQQVGQKDKFSLRLRFEACLKPQGWVKGRFEVLEVIIDIFNHQLMAKYH